MLHPKGFGASTVVGCSGGGGGGAGGVVIAKCVPAKRNVECNSVLRNVSVLNLSLYCLHKKVHRPTASSVPIRFRSDQQVSHVHDLARSRN